MVQVHSASDGKPVRACAVHVGGRMAISDPGGKIVFDGIPAGAYTISCQHPGYQKFQKKVELSNGVRMPQLVAMVPEILSPLKFSFVEETTGEAVGQVRIHLTPKVVASALHGPLLFSANRAGNAATVPVPEGIYQLKIDAPGFHGIIQDYEHKAAEEPVQFKLKAIAKVISCTVIAKSDDGTSLSNAEVELWEVYPRAKIASGRTGAGGTITFSDLRLGTVNPTAEDKSLPVTHRAEAVLRVQAEGYVSALKSVRLQNGTSLAMMLTPVATIPERESNNSIGNAQRLKPGQSASFVIDKPSDQDWFVFDLPEATRVKLAFNSCPLETTASIFDSAGERVAHLNRYGGRPANGVWDLARGHYSIRVTEWGMNGSSKEEIIMTLSAETAADPLEDNDSPTAARPIQVGQHMRGLLFPVGDADHFTLHLDRPGCLRLDSMYNSGIERAVHIFDKNDKDIAHLNCYTGRGGAAEWQFQPGDYRIEVTEWNNNGCSLDPYDFRFVMMTDDDLDDPAVHPGSRVSSVRHLPLPGRTYASIIPVGDSDIYTVSIPSKGKLHIYQHGPTELNTRILDGLGHSVAECHSYGNRSGSLNHPFQAASTVYLEVIEWGNNGWSPYPYELRAWFEPAGEIERLQNNETLKMAVPMELGAVVRDNIFPVRDQDWYQLVVDQPGMLNVWNHARTELSVTLHDSAQKAIGTMNTYGERHNQINWNVLPGVYFLNVGEWGNNGETPWDYALKATLHRAVPGETEDLKKSPVIPLKMNEAQPCGIEHVGDVERFRVSIPAKGEYDYIVGGPLETYTVVKDLRAGKTFFDFNAYGHRTSNRSFTTEGPMELELTITERGNDGAGIRPNWIMIGSKGASLNAASVEWTVDPIFPTKITFKIRETPGVSSLPVVSLDINTDGQSDAILGRGQSIALDFPTQGLYRVASSGSIGPVSSRGEFWVQATGQPVRKGTRVMVAVPGEGELIDQVMPVRVTALSYEGKAIRQVNLQINGRSVGVDYTMPYEFEVPWQTFAGDSAALVAAAIDSSGKQTTAERHVKVSGYFGLLPNDGAVVTGNDVTVSWEGGAFGSARVRYRPVADEANELPWKEVVGQNARSRRVRISDLEAGKAYEFQPLGGTEPGPIRQVTRVKGLAFTEARYGGTIARDYDQKIPVGVRNHAEEPRTVRLRCTLPQDSLLLAEFVGDGEKGRPVDLEPGEQRIFTLGFSAQDVIKELHTLPIYIQSEDGFSDEAEVEVRVKLPRVELEWVDVTGERREGLNRSYELINRGDTLTDLNVSAAEDTINIQPEVKHGLFKAGARMRFEVYPKIYEGFTSCKDLLQATSIGRTESIGYEGALKPGEEVYRLNMTAGLDPVTGEPNDVADTVRAARRLVGQYLSAATVDWTLRTDPRDTNRDGKPDRWTVVDEMNQTQWFGRDTDGDNEVDFAQADVGLDGEIDHASILENGEWRMTNLLDAWLEMNFSIPKHRSKYQPHDLDLVVNGQVVGRLEQTIPEGNYRFGLSPSALTWGAGDNDLEINSHFLNFAHYAISSDFQLKTRMLATDMFMVGTSRSDALERLFESDKGFSTEGPDYSLSSEDLDYSPKNDLKKGQDVTIAGSIRNLGASAGQNLEIALFLAVPGTEGKLLTRQTIDPPGMMTETPFSFTWPAAPGVHSLRIVADPDNFLNESNRKNNAAIVNVTVPGEDALPTLTISQPEDGFETPAANVELHASAADDAGIIGIEVSVDNGMAQPLQRTAQDFSGMAQLQPGSHTLKFRAIDSGGQRVEETRTVTVKAERPSLQIIHPTSGAVLDEAGLQVLVSAQDVDQAAMRVNNGSWFGLTDNNGTWSGKIDLPFGPCRLDAVVINSAGIRQTQRVDVRCTAQPKEEKEDREKKKDKDKEGNDEPDEPGGGRAEPQTDDGPGRDNNTPNQPQDTKPAGDRPIAPPQTGTKPTSDQDNKTARDTHQPPGSSTSGRGGTPPRGSNANTGSTSPQGGSSPGSGQAGKGRDQEPAEDRSDDDAGDTSSEPIDEPIPADVPEENQIVPPQGGAAAAPAPRARPYVPPARSRPRSGRRPPSGFAFNRQRNDWYCPNRPNIRIKFKLPEWLTKEEFDKILKKGPNSKEWKNLESKLLAGYWSRNFGKKFKGQTMDKLLEKYRDLLLKRCDRLDPVDGKLPTFLQSLGFASPDPPTDPKELAAWRNKMKEMTQVYWLRLLATEDPSTVIQGMQQRAKSLSKYDEAAAMQADAIVQEIKANQEFTEEIIEALPYAGEVLDVYAIATGETALSGRQVDAFEMFMRSVGVGIPAAQTLYGKGKVAKQFMESFAEAYKHGGDEFTSALVNTFKKAGKELDPKVLNKAYDTIQAFKKQARQAAKSQLDDVADTAGDAFRKSVAGQAAEARKLADEKQARELIDRLNKATDPDEIADITKKLQHDKTAQRLINDDAVSQATRDKMIDYLDDATTGKGLYQKTDNQVKNFFNDAMSTTDPKKLQNMADEVGMSPKQLQEFQDDVQAFAKKNGLDVDDLEVDVVAPTNKKTGKRTVGRDRDVTYRVKIKEEALAKAGNPRVKTMDIHHDVSTNVYQKNLWEQANPGKKLSSMDEAAEFADGMDQMVTSAKHHEAYDIGELTVEEFFEGGLGNVSVTGNKQLDNFTDTMKKKSSDWFEKTTGDAVKNTTEGMRQATKQYDKAITTRLKKYNIDPDTFLDPKLAKGKEVFDQVTSGKITLEQGEHMLKAIGTSKEEVVEGIADTFRKIEESGPAKMFRQKGQEALQQTVQKSLTDKNSAEALEATVSALKNGEVTGEAFKAIRNDVIVKVGDNVSAAELGTYMKRQLINAAEFTNLANRIARRTGRSVDDVIKEAESR